MDSYLCILCKDLYKINQHVNVKGDEMWKNLLLTYFLKFIKYLVSFSDRKHFWKSIHRE